MSSPDLRALLAQLHERLGSTRSLDEESRRLLGTVARDIEHALKNNDSSAVEPEPVEALAVRFEADHPSLAGKSGDSLLDSWIFGGAKAVDCVWIGGKRVVNGAVHHAHDAVSARFRKAMIELSAA